MDKPRGLTSGWITALASIFLVAGAAMLSIAEGRVPLVPDPVTYPTLPVYDYSFPQTATPQSTDPAVEQITPTVPQANPCPIPAGWQIYRVLPGDSLQSLSLLYPASPEELASANCLLGDFLPPSSFIYLPPVSATLTFTPTQPQTVCGPPPGWVPYRIQPLDNLFRLSLAFGISIPQLQFANCLGNSTNIYAGDFLMVPNIPTRTPVFTLAPTQPWTATITSSPTRLPSASPFPSGTFTQTLQPTLTPSPTSSFTPTSTQSLPFTPTLSGTPSITPSVTPSPTATSSPTPEG